MKIEAIVTLNTFFRIAKGNLPLSSADKNVEQLEILEIGGCHESLRSQSGKLNIYLPVTEQRHS